VDPQIDQGNAGTAWSLAKTQHGVVSRQQLLELGFGGDAIKHRVARTPAQQACDRLRDQAHTAAGLTPLRFTHAQVRYEPDHVMNVLAAVARP
jgi:hypothetical protein